MRWPDALTRPLLLLNRAPPTLRLVYLLKALDSYGYFALSEVFTTYFSEFGVDDITAGTLYGLWGMLITVWGMVTGFAIDWMGVRSSLISCYCLQIFARLLLSFTTSKTTAIITLFTVQALATSWGAPVMAIAIKQLVRDSDRVVSFGLFYSMMNVAALLSGLAIDFLRLAAPASGYRYLGVNSPIRGVVFSTVVSSVAALFVATKFGRHTIRVGHVGAVSQGKTKADASSVSNSLSRFMKTVSDLPSSKTFWQFLAMGLFTVNLKQVFRHLDATFPKFAVRKFGCDAPFGLIYAVNPAMIIVGVPIVASATVNRKHFDMIFGGAWVSALAPFFLAFFSNYFGAVSFVVVLSIGEMAWSPRWYDYTMACAPDGKEGVFGALALAPLFLAKLPTGILGGVLLQKFCPGRVGGDCLPSSGGDGSGYEQSVSSQSVPSNPCDGLAVWGIIGLVTLTSPLLIAFFYPWLKDSGTESSVGPSYGQTVSNPTAASINHSPYHQLDVTDDITVDAVGDLATVGSRNINQPYAQTDSDDENTEFELVPLRPEPRRKAQFE